MVYFINFYEHRNALRKKQKQQQTKQTNKQNKNNKQNKQTNKTKTTSKQQQQHILIMYPTKALINTACVHFN